MTSAPHQSAAAQLAEFLGLHDRVFMPGDALLTLQSFTARTDGPLVFIEARYARYNSRSDGTETIKRFVLHELHGAGDEP